MKYDFDKIIDRKGTNSMNVEGFKGYIFKAYPTIEFPYADDEFVRMWVADMEFATAPEVIDAVKERADHGIFGYTSLYDDRYYRAFSSWCRRLYDWDFPQEQLVFTLGVVAALYELIGDLVPEGKKVLTFTPAYSYFLHAAEHNNRELICSPLKKDGGGRFVIDWDDFEEKASAPDVSVLVLCSPHNPTGRVWTLEELERIGDIIRRNGLWVISDEIHCDILRSGKRHIPLGKVMPDYRKLVTCMSASKAFNLAGMMMSNIIIRDESLRALVHSHETCDMNPLSIAAVQAAYERGYDWLLELRSYLDANFDYMYKFLKERIPSAVPTKTEATYLAWIDVSRVLPSVGDLPLFFAQKAGVLLEGGDSLFVGNAEGYIRLNLAMPKIMLAKGLERIAAAVDEYQKNPTAIGR